MEYRIETIEEATVVHLIGAVDRTARGSLEMQLLSLVRYGSKLIFEMSEVSFISSAGLHLLLDIYSRCQEVHASMAVTGLSEPVREVFSLVGFLSSGLSIYDTLEEGLAALQTKKGSGRLRGEDSYGAPTDVSAPPPSAPPVKRNGGGEAQEVHFSAFYPKEVAVEEWYSLLVYMYVPSMLEAVRRDASKFEDEIGAISETKPATTKLARGTQVTIVPSCEGVKFNPERISFQWLEDKHRAQFRMQAQATLAGTAGNVQVTVYVGPLIVATMKMGMLFHETEADVKSSQSEEASVSMYHRDDIFISYSHRDTDIVDLCKKAYEALGYNVLVDYETLRSGQNWNAELMRMIERADIFQLFWSENTSQSKYCRQEWQYALGLKRGEGFIRPVYWKEPLPAPPAELSALHFDFAPFTVAD